MLQPADEEGLCALREEHQCSPLFSAKKQQAVQPPSGDLRVLELLGTLPAALLVVHISTGLGRKGPC